ncbi:type IV toxin-antitoxin system AbiEi family antitoxin domain-containing protein [Pseudomonas sp. WS 5011]|uniref:type IV toxin-antitoxin system AbiEi family antitoxin domain-containing protein n=1 Tax=Pseudomonas sp. WS 5011 TaxID=2717477 RepID=UPI001475CCF0|nr:type IV toxin-antitoxin system AbiEi family antitoxin domain-containing protein [Pseudomonas sp. WS 5011]NMY53079.1 hypothetical protein [Pseudomonas sp. WS 5011]
MMFECFIDIANILRMKHVNKRSHKLLELGTAFPEHVVVPREWLVSQGFEDDRLSRFVSSGYLVRVGRGLYAKPLGAISWDARDSILSNAPSWRVALNSVLLTSATPIAVAGYSALWLQNLAHYVSDFQDSSVTVTTPAAIPKWMSSMTSVTWRQLDSKKLFSGRAGDPDAGEIFHLGRHELEMALVGTGLEIFGFGQTQSWCLISSPERALVEWASLLKTQDDWEHLIDVVEGMGTLRPHLLTAMLIACRSVKAKRAVLWTAREYGRSWYKPVVAKIDQIDLGSGARQLIKGGVFDHEYKITVPRRENSEPTQYA